MLVSRREQSTKITILNNYNDMFNSLSRIPTELQ